MLTFALVAVFPLALLALMLLMERVERPLRRGAGGQQLLEFLETARPEEVEAFVSEGYASALDRYWRRRRVRRILAGARSRQVDRAPQEAVRAARRPGGPTG